ncbi:MAG: serine/threonine-protein kinase [Pyrinomonadaceae bacterium]|nr:serine/threonine-protein kinase [Pyrinomonadaceae bacterium]
MAEPLTANAIIAHYRIVSKIGEGGMGEVYRARDPRLNRDVAIKVLPEPFLTDPERLVRFQREAQVLASLNHPNIAAIYGLEEGSSNGPLGQNLSYHALVMELVEGPTLAERIAAGRIPLDEALPIARQIAEALEVAHERNIIHRDLKPANVKVTPEGTVKVLDFGLAKVFEGESQATDLSHSPTLIKGTQAGVILGTAAYMSPEQAKGKVVDKRSDIWAFGCVLFEMLSGKQTFSGETLTDTLAAVVRAEPDWDSLPAATPSALRQLLRRCLSKDQKQRLRDIGEARILLENPQGPVEVSNQPSTQVSKSHANRLAWIAGIALAFLAGGAGVWFLRPSASEIPLRKLELQIPALDTESSYGYSISPNAKMIAYVSNHRLWIRDLDRLEPREIPNTQNATHPFWSPDSAYLGYVVGKKMWKVSSGGSGATLIADLPGAFSGAGAAGWQSDGNIVFTTGFTGLMKLPEKGGDPSSLLKIGTDEADFHDVELLPDNRGVVFAVHRAVQGLDTLAVFDGKARKTVFQLEGQRISDPVYSPSGHILFTRQLSNEGIWALPFSLDRLEATGEPFLVVPGAAAAKVSADGTLVFAYADVTRDTRLVLKDRKGQIVRNIQTDVVPFQMPSVRLSPDGKQAVLATRESGKTDYWVVDMERGTRTRVTSDNVARGWFCGWTPDGQSILYASGDAPSARLVLMKPADGSGEARELVKAIGAHFSLDQKHLIYATAVNSQGTWDLWYTAIETGAKPEPFLITPTDESSPEFSPDGSYVAYVSNESDQNEVYIKPFPNGEGKWRVSTGGGGLPHWSRRGNELFFVAGNDLIVVPVRTKPALALGTPQKLFSREGIRADRPEGTLDSYDVTPDGQHFVMLEGAEAPNERRVLNVVQNWFAEFSRI